MNDTVYLFELDSVITAPKECQKAQEKLFMEIMKGNRVVLSHNQILSITMFDLLDINQEKYTRRHILNLIEKGRICVSEYNDLKTPSAYIASKMKPGADMFKFSCLRFLNGIENEQSVFNEIKNAFESGRAWRSWRDIKIDVLNTDQKKILREYVSVMKELSDRLHVYESPNTPNPDLEYYIKKVKSAVLSAGNNPYGFIPNLVENAAKNVDTMLDKVHKSNQNVYRSACLTALRQIKDTDEASLNLANAILDMSYNYQVERSIANLTVTHEMDDASIAKTVAHYYENHSFSDIENIVLPKEDRILAWEIIDDFSEEFKKEKDTNVDNHTCMKKFLFKSVLKTLFTLVVIALFFLLGNYIESSMSWVGRLLNIALIGGWFILEFMNWIFPTSIFDGFSSLIKLWRYFIAYSKFKEGKSYYITINLKERVCEKFTREEKDD